MRSVLYAFPGSATLSGFRRLVAATHSAPCRRRLRRAHRHLASVAGRSSYRAGARLAVERDRTQVLLFGADTPCESARQQECSMTRCPPSRRSRPPRASAAGRRPAAGSVTVDGRNAASARAKRPHRVRSARSPSGSDLLVRDAAVTTREQVGLSCSDSLVTRPSSRGTQRMVNPSWGCRRVAVARTFFESGFSGSIDLLDGED